MQQPWIHKAKTDSIFILSPSFLVVSIVFLFQKQLQQIETKYSFYTWLFLITLLYLKPTLLQANFKKGKNY